jgi:hypothetical protein
MAGYWTRESSIAAERSEREERSATMEEEKQEDIQEGKEERERCMTLLRFMIQTVLEAVYDQREDCDRYIDNKWPLVDSKEKEKEMDRIAKEMHDICKYYTKHFENGWKEHRIEDWY